MSIQVSKPLTPVLLAATAMVLVAAPAGAQTVRPFANILLAPPAPPPPLPGPQALPMPVPDIELMMAVPQAPAVPSVPDLPELPEVPLLPRLPDFEWTPDPAWLADIEERVADAVAHARELAESKLGALDAFHFAQTPKPAAVPAPPKPPVPTLDRQQLDRDRAEAIYQSARNLIDQSRYERAIAQFDRLADVPGAFRADAALYWKAYAQAKLAALSDSLATLAALRKQFANSAWLDAARALEVEVKQASGQAVSPDLLADEDLKLLALRGLMQTDPDRALPMVQQLLAGNSSVRVKENALFVLSQSRAPRARDIIAEAARSGSNPDVQLTAVRYLGAMRGTDNQQLLDDIYRRSSDEAVKRAVLEALHRARASQRLAEIARAEKDVSLKRSAVRNLGTLGAEQSGDLLKGLYPTEPDVKREIISALANQRNATALIELARAEKDQARKKEIVSRLSTMRSKEAADYMLELLK